MNRPLKLSVFALLLMGGSFAFAQETTQPANEPVLFKRTFTNGLVEKYVVTSQISSNTDLSSVGQDVQSMNFDTSMDATYTYSNVKEDGSALLTFLFNNIKMKAEGPMAEMMGQMGDQTPKEIKGTQTVNPFFKITNTKMETANSSMMQMMGGNNISEIFAFVAFPTKAVAIGDTWEADVPSMGGMFEKGAKMTGKFVGAGEIGDKKVWNLQFTGKPKMTIDIGKMMAENPNQGESGMPPMNILMEGTTSMLIKVAVDQTTFQILSVDSASETDGKVKLVDMGMEFPSTGQQVSKIVVKK
ncbi:MAG: hypothetical protein JNK63_00300 [Chthonomonas sp.]|nr:hypothetical protein [Chthonomonas sp.]